MTTTTDPPPPLLDVPAPPYEAVPPITPVSNSAAAVNQQHQPSRNTQRHQENKYQVMEVDQVVAVHTPYHISRPAPAAISAHRTKKAHQQQGAAFSIEDLEVARALTGLRQGSSEPPASWREPSGEQTPASPAQSIATITSATFAPSPTPTPANQQPEPLLQLLTSQHPLIASTINNSISAYSSSKTYSPRFRQGAEFVERNIASPVASTVGTAGRISGVETGVRWMLRRTASSTSGEDGAQHKRRKLDPDAMDVEQPQQLTPTSPGVAHLSRASSDLSQHEFLPAYDDNRSPVYEEEYAVAAPHMHERRAFPPQNWQTRLMISTSGLGVAMSDESLRSLKYCLSWLRWANSHLGRVMASLQSVLREWEQAQKALADAESGMSSSPPLSPGDPSHQRQPRDPAAIAQSLTALKAECVKTLKGALDVVSTYAGGALPENARVLVRRHLTSLPMRFQVAAAASSSPESRSRTGSVSGTSSGDVEAQSDPNGTLEAVSGARRVVVLAREGLDMMAQVGAVVDGTINSAEEWCARLGRKREGSQSQGKLPLLATSQQSIGEEKQAEPRSLQSTDVSEKTTLTMEALAEQRLKSMTMDAEQTA